jgi:hypothetical protein
MNAFRATYPTVCEFIAGTPFEGRVFALNELMWLLCGAVFAEWENAEATQLEQDLAAIVGTVGIAAARTAYKEKFLVEAKCNIQRTPRVRIFLR